MPDKPQPVSSGKPISAGALRRRVQLCKPAPTTNSLGEAVPGWTVVYTTWASIEPLSGRELWQAVQVQADVTHKVRVRYHSGLDPTWIVKYQGRQFNVMSVLNIEERSRVLELLCMEQVPA